MHHQCYHLGHFVHWRDCQGWTPYHHPSFLLGLGVMCVGQFLFVFQEVKHSIEQTITINTLLRCEKQHFILYYNMQQLVDFFPTVVDIFFSSTQIFSTTILSGDPISKDDRNIKICSKNTFLMFPQNTFHLQREFAKFIGGIFPMSHFGYNFSLDGMLHKQSMTPNCSFSGITWSHA